LSVRKVPRETDVSSSWCRRHGPWVLLTSNVIVVSLLPNIKRNLPDWPSMRLVRDSGIGNQHVDRLPEMVLCVLKTRLNLSWVCHVSCNREEAFGGLSWRLLNRTNIMSRHFTAGIFTIVEVSSSLLSISHKAAIVSNHCRGRRTEEFHNGSGTDTSSSPLSNVI
jgi:hypothetical protein